MFIPYSMPRFSLTGFGYSAILLGLFILLMAVNYNNNLLFTAVYFWFALLFTSGIRGLLQFVSLPDGRWTFAELFASNENQLQLCIDNDRFEGHLYIHGERDCIWRAHITDIGVQQLIAPDFVGIELLGLWRFRKPAPLLAPVCVYPARLRTFRCNNTCNRRSLPLKRWMRSALCGRGNPTTVFVMLIGKALRACKMAINHVGSVAYMGGINPVACVTSIGRICRPWASRHGVKP